MTMRRLRYVIPHMFVCLFDFLGVKIVLIDTVHRTVISTLITQS